MDILHRRVSAQPALARLTGRIHLREHPHRIAPIHGHRGLPRGDLTALARAVAAFSRLATQDRAVLEAEANPVMVTTDGVTAVDALVTLATDRQEIPR